VRRLLRLIALLVFAAASLLLIDRWQVRDPYGALTPLDPLPHTQELIAQNHWEQAEAYLGYFIEHNSTAVTPQARELLSAIRAKRNSWEYKAKALLNGAVTGRGEEVEGMVGAGVADLFVVGDLRDLFIEGNHWLNGEEVDEVILALSSLGIAATAATISTAGGAGGIKGTTSLLKNMRRGRLLPAWLLKALARLPSASDTRRAANTLMEPIADLYRTSGFLGARTILSQSKSLKELQKMRFFAKQFGKESAVLLRIDPVALRLAEHAPARAVTRASLYGKPGFKALAKQVKYATRLSKYISKHYQQLLRMVPLWLLIVVWFGALGGVVFLRRRS